MSRASLVVLSCIYGVFVAYTVASWSFDYSAVIETAEFFVDNNLSYFEVLAFNSFSLYFIIKLFNDIPVDFVVAVFYGFCAALRFFTYGLVLRIKWFFPVFFSNAVMLDYNTSRYSLAISLFILTLWSTGWRPLRDRGAIDVLGNKRLAFFGILFFHLHHFSVAFIALFSRLKIWHRALLIAFVPTAILLLRDVFSRFLAVNNDPFPGIAGLYFCFVLILLVGRRLNVGGTKVIVSILLFVASLKMAGVSFNPQYYTRFSLLAFDLVLLVTSWTYASGREWNVHSGKVNYRYLSVLLICCLSCVYQIILINGNVWRFF